MGEYKKYKGLYIGQGCFNSKEEIDQFLDMTGIMSEIGRRLENGEAAESIVKEFNDFR